MMRSGTELRQFLVVFLTTSLYRNVDVQEFHDQIIYRL